MEYVMGICPQCNNVMSMPGDSEKVRCPTCQSEVLMAEASALAAASGMTAPASQPQADPYAQAQQQPFQQPDNPYGQAPAPQFDSSYASQQPAAFIGNQPILQSWETNVLYTALGIVASIVLNLFTGSETVNQSATLSGAISILMLAYIVFCIVYAAKIYPSYFTDKPMITSVPAINFLNGLVGGLIWGLLWNHNLTLQNKGISHIVYIVLIAVGFVLGIAAAFLLVTVALSGGTI